MTTRNTPSLPAARLALNATKLCSAPGCDRHRAGISRHCSMHAQRIKFFGTYDGKRICASEYKTEARQIRGVLKTNHDNPSVIAALAFLDEYMDRAVRCEDVPGQEDLARARLLGATSRELLIELAAVTLFLRRHEFKRDAHKELPYHIGRHTILIKPRRKDEARPNDPTRYVTLTSGRRLAIGRYIQEHLGLFFRNLADRVLADEVAVIDRATLLKTPILKAGGLTP